VREPGSENSLGNELGAEKGSGTSYHTIDPLFRNISYPSSEGIYVTKANRCL
jgi:hypothetical protein